MAKNNHVSSELTIRGLTIILESRRVYVNDKEVNLTAKEYDLLLFLAKNPDKVFSKEYLFDSVWGMDHFGDISTITVHIGKVREKIEADSSNPQYIETIWGAGYRFKV